VEPKVDDTVMSMDNRHFRGKKQRFQGHRATTASPSTQNKFMSKIGRETPKSEEKKSKVVAFLENVPLLSKDSLSDVLDAMVEVETSFGEVIFEAGQLFPYFVLLVQGTMELDGEEVKYANAEALLETSPVQKTLRMSSNGLVWVIPRVQFQNVTVNTWKNKLTKGGSLLESITEIPGLKELPQESREAIAMALKPVQFKKGEFLMKKGEVGQIMYFIEEGSVEIKRGDETIAERGRGDYIGEGALLDEDVDNGVRNASAIAATAVSCLALDRDGFREYMGSMRELFEFNLCTRVLRSLELMKDLDDSQLSMIVSTLSEFEYLPSEFVVHQGELGEVFYIIKGGTFDCVIQEDGETKRIGTLLAGDYFGEGALLTNAPRRCDVRAVGSAPGQVWALKRSSFELFLSPKLKEDLGLTFQRRSQQNTKESEEIQWDDLEKIRTLGSGSYGTVDLVRNKITGETCALKRIRKATVVAKKQQRFVKNERDLLAQCDSPFIVNLVRTFNMGDSIYMLMEVCLCGELYTLMKDTVDKNYAKDENADGCFEMETQCRFFTACAVLAIEHLHAKGIVHRDIKPENLLISENGYLKLADLGFAKMVLDQRTYSLCGTPEYTAPEVYKRCGHSKGVDWWALGVIVYEMASGFSPFHVPSDNSWDCYIEISKYEKYYPNIQFPNDFSSSLGDFLLKIMNPNPSKRYGSRKNTTAQLKAHPYFGTQDYSYKIDWEAIENRTYVLPEDLRPRKPESGVDGMNFEACDDRHLDDALMVNAAMMGEAGSSWYAEF